MSAGMSGAGGSAGPRRAPQSWLSVRVGSSAGRWRRGVGVGVIGGLAAAVAVAAGPAMALQPGPPSVLHVGQIGRQDVPVLPGSEPDTLVEPDIAVSPVNPDFGGRGRPRRPVPGRWRGRHRARVDHGRRRHLASRAAAWGHG